MLQVFVVAGCERGVCVHLLAVLKIQHIRAHVGTSRYDAAWLVEGEYVQIKLRGIMFFLPFYC